MTAAAPPDSAPMRPDLSAGAFIVSRAAEADRIAAFILAHKTKLVFLSGPAASGKSVLVTRWLIPALRAAPATSGRRVYYMKCRRTLAETTSTDNGGEEHLADLLSQRAIIIADEFDRIFDLGRDERRVQLDDLFARLEHANPDAVIVAVIGEQHLTSVYALSSYDPAVVGAVCEIHPVGLADGLEQLAAEDAHGITYSSDVLLRLREESAELEHRGVDVTFDLLKLLHERFCREARETGLTRIDLAQYEKIGGLLGVVREHVALAIDELEARRPGTEGIARAVLERVLEAQARGGPADFTDIGPRFEVSHAVVNDVVVELRGASGLLFESAPNQYQFQPVQIAAIVEEDAALRQLQSERAARIIEEGLRSRQQIGTFLPAARFAEIHRERARLVVDDEMVRFLVQCALRDETPGTAAAAYWLRRVALREDAMDVLLTAAFDTSPIVRERVALLLGAFPEALVSERLCVLALTDAEPAVRTAAVSSLANMADDALLERLLQEVNKPTSQYRRQALEALRIFPRAAVAGVLRDVVADPQSDLALRREAVQVLAALDIDQSVDGLIDIALNDADADDRAAAAKALASTTSEPLNHRILEQLDWRPPTRRIVIAAVLLALGLSAGAVLGGVSMIGLLLTTRAGLSVLLVVITIVTAFLLVRLRDGRVRWKSPAGLAALALYALCAITVLPIVHGLAHMMVKRYRRGVALLGLEALGIFMYAVLAGATAFVPIPGLGFLAALYRVAGLALFAGSYLYDVLAVLFRTVLFRHAMTREERRAAIYRETFQNPVMADAVFAELRGTSPDKVRRAKRLVRGYGGSMQPARLLQMLTAADASYRPWVVWALREAKDDASIATLETMAPTARTTQQIAIAAVLGGNPTARSIEALRRISAKTSVFLRVLAATATLRFRLSVWPWSARLAALCLVPAMGVLLYHGAMIKRNPAWSQIITLRQPLPSATQKAKIVDFLVDAYPRESASQLRALFEERRGRPVDSLHAALVRGLVAIQDSTVGDATLRRELAEEADQFDQLLRRDSTDFVIGLGVMRAMTQSSDSSLGQIATRALVRYVNEDTSLNASAVWRKQAVVRVLGAAPYARGLPALDTLLKARVADKVQSKNRAAGAFADAIRQEIVQSAKQAGIAVAEKKVPAERAKLLTTLDRLDVSAPELSAVRRDVQRSVEAPAHCDRNADGVCDDKDDVLAVIAENPNAEDGYRDLLSHFTPAKQFRQAADTFALLATRYPASIWPRKILAELYHESRSVSDTAAFGQAYSEMIALRRLDAFRQLERTSPSDYARVEADFVEVALTAGHFVEAEGSARSLLALPGPSVDRLNMRLFIYMAAVMRHDANAASARLSDLENQIRSLPSNYYNNWVYPGTLAFIDRIDLAPPVKAALRKLCKEGQWYPAQQAADVIAENRAALKSL